MSANQHSHTFWQDGQLRTIVVDYEHDEISDTYTVKFAGAVLRDSSLKWRELAAALFGMARR